MPKFSIRSLLLATALLAVGLTILALADGHGAVPLTLAFTAIGAGIWTLFNRPLVGALLGFLVVPAMMAMARVAEWMLAS